MCPYGGIGIHNRLKICRQNWLAGSSPARDTINTDMIEHITELDKQQYANIANYFIEWLEMHPYPEEDDDVHRTIRMSATTYLHLYENFLDLYTYVVKSTYIPKSKSLH